MATTGIIKGRIYDLYSNAAVIDHLTNVSLTLGTETIDITSYDSSNYKDILPGDKSWSISATAYLAFDATEGYDELVADWDAQAAITVLLSTAETGDSTLTGSAYITSFNPTGSLADPMTFSVTYSGTGALTIGTVA